MDKIRDGNFEAVLNRINEMRGYPLSYVARDGIDAFLRDISAIEGWGAVERLLDKITKLSKVPDNTLGAVRTMWDEMGREKHRGADNKERVLTDYEDEYDRRRCDLWCAIYKHNHLDITAFDADRRIPELSRIRTTPYRQGDENDVEVLVTEEPMPSESTYRNRMLVLDAWAAWLEEILAKEAA